MVILDTNVISNVLALKPDAAVEVWLKAQPIASIFTTAVTKAEILRGLRILPDGRRRRALEDAIRPIFASEFEGRVLPFDSEAAEAYAELSALRRKIGRPISQSDAQIAAIALSRGASLVTRNAIDFRDIGLTIINPWEGSRQG